MRPKQSSDFTKFFIHYTQPIDLEHHQAFKPAVAMREVQDLDEPMVKLHKRKPVKVRVWVEDRDRATALFQRLALEGNQMDRFAALLGWVEQQLEHPMAGAGSVESEVEQVPVPTEAESRQEEPEVGEESLLEVGSREENLELKSVEPSLPKVVEQPLQTQETQIVQEEAALVQTEQAATIQEGTSISPTSIAQSTAQEQAWQQIAALSTTVNRLVEQLAQERSELPRSAAVQRSAGSSRRVGQTTTASATKSNVTTPGADGAATKADAELPRAIRSTENAEAKINAAIDAVVTYNNAPGRTHEDKWAFGVAQLKRLTRANQKVIERVVQQRKPEIEKHHHHHELGPNHNIRKGRQGFRIEDTVPFEWH